MAFALVSVSDQSFEQPGRPAVWRQRPAAWVGIRRAIAIVAAGWLHLGLLALLLNSGGWQAVLPKQTPTMTLVAIGQAGASAAVEMAAESIVRQPSQAAPLLATQAQSLPEWQVTAIASDASVAAATAAALPTADTGDCTRSAAFDPYAGASPRREARDGTDCCPAGVSTRMAGLTSEGTTLATRSDCI